MRGAVGLTPLTVFVAILAGTQLMNVVGAVLAIPIAATIQVILTDYLDQRKIRRTSESMPVSSWRWMLNRGIGRDTREPEPEPDPDDASDNEQIVGDDIYPGVERPRDEQTRAADAAEATWPANPWRSRGNATPAQGTPWRGMPRPTRAEPAGPANTGPSRPAAASTDEDDDPGTPTGS
jgi:hypothetical protein